MSQRAYWLTNPLTEEVAMWQCQQRPTAPWSKIIFEISLKSQTSPWRPNHKIVCGWCELRIWICVDFCSSMRNVATRPLCSGIFNYFLCNQPKRSIQQQKSKTKKIEKKIFANFFIQIFQVQKFFTHIFFDSESSKKCLKIWTIFMRGGGGLVGGRLSNPK